MRKILDFILGRKEVKNQILFNADNLETRVALLENGELTDFYVEALLNEAPGPHRPERGREYGRLSVLAIGTPPGPARD